MLDIGWSELLVIGVIALIVVGPKDLPRVLRFVGYWVGKARSMAREFQRVIDEYAQEAELDDVKNAVQTPMRAKSAIKNMIDPTGSLEKELTSTDSEIKQGLQDAAAGGAATVGGEEAPAAAASAGTLPDSGQSTDEEASAAATSTETLPDSSQSKDKEAPGATTSVETATSTPEAPVAPANDETDKLQAGSRS